MEVLLLSKIEIKSALRNYEVLFKNSLNEVLNITIIEGDYLIIDEKVFNFLTEFEKSLIKKNPHILLNATEEQKSFEKLSSVIDNLISNRFGRQNKIIAIGGGIIQDITAFISSILYRGVKWVFIPTTLLSQCDSCIGGKTSINIGEYKNQLGNFYPPSKIFVIPKLLDSLSLLDFKSGLGEMLHFYLVSSEKDFEFFEKNYDSVFNNKQLLMDFVMRNLYIKKYFIEKDEFDNGERLLLNYGHSFGHALESITNYRIPHGIAVSYGMDIANFISVKLDFLDKSTRNDIRLLLEKIWSGTSIEDINVDDFENALSKDKKNIGNTYQVILTRGIGKMFKHGITPNKDFTNWLKEYFSANEN